MSPAPYCRFDSHFAKHLLGAIAAMTCVCTGVKANTASGEKTISVRYQDGQVAKGVAIELQYPSSFRPFRITTDERGEARFERRNFGYLVVIAKYGNEEIVIGVDADSLKWPLEIVLPLPPGTKNTKGKFRLLAQDGAEIPIDEVVFFDLDGFRAKRLRIPLSDIEKHIGSRYSKVQLLGKGISISVTLPIRMLESDGTLRLGLR